jgi:hypothetical protein
VSGHLSPAQVDLIDEFDAGIYTDIEFTGMALEIGMTHMQALKVIRERDQADAIAAEEHREDRAAGGQFGAGA